MRLILVSLTGASPFGRGSTLNKVREFDTQFTTRRKPYRPAWHANDVNGLIETFIDLASRKRVIITNVGSANFGLAIATFNLSGTLWPEKLHTPFYPWDPAFA